MCVHVCDDDGIVITTESTGKIRCQRVASVTRRTHQVARANNVSHMRWCCALSARVPANRRSSTRS